MHILYALRKGELVFVDNVENGLKSSCICSACGEKLIAKNGGRKKLHHFAHCSGADCAHGFETSIHLLAKKVLMRSKNIHSPELRLEYNDSNFKLPLLNAENINFDNVESEIGFERIIPDLTCYSGNNIKMFIEIKVTHGIDDDKYLKLKEYNIPTMEIDLSDIDRNIDEKTLEDIFYRESKSKKWISHSLFTDYDEKISLIAIPKVPSSRGTSFYYDHCPIAKRKYKGRTYANVAKDCFECKHFIDRKERGIRCFGRFNVTTKNDFDSLFNEYIENPDRFNKKYPFGRKLEKTPIKEVDLRKDKVIDNVLEIKLSNLGELWELNNCNPFRAVNELTGMIVDINSDPYIQWNTYNGRCYGIRQQNGKYYGSGEIYYSRASEWRIIK